MTPPHETKDSETMGNKKEKNGVSIMRMRVRDFMNGITNTLKCDKITQKEWAELFSVLTAMLSFWNTMIKERNLWEKIDHNVVYDLETMIETARMERLSAKEKAALKTATDELQKQIDELIAQKESIRNSVINGE